MNRIQKALEQDKKLLSIYFTAGYPELDDTVPIIRELERCGVDMIEIGLPFSDPLADGPIIQQSSTRALANGMNTERLFEQLREIRKEVSIPLLIMGYFNPILQYGIEAFCAKCKSTGIDGLILPDLPLREYQLHYKVHFEAAGLVNVFLITPQTSEDRIREIDGASDGFIYMVSSASTTGKKTDFSHGSGIYFDRVAEMPLRNKRIVGFGINDANSFKLATATCSGGIVGSAFIKMLNINGKKGIEDFIKSLRP